MSKDMKKNPGSAIVIESTIKQNVFNSFCLILQTDKQQWKYNLLLTGKSIIQNK